MYCKACDVVFMPFRNQALSLSTALPSCLSVPHHDLGMEYVAYVLKDAEKILLFCEKKSKRIVSENDCLTRLHQIVSRIEQ